ncbi:MAG: DMT family transporter [Breznakia sp.]
MERKATLALFLTALLWGFGFIGVENALHSGWQTFPLLCFRGLFGGACLCLFSYKQKWWKNKTTVSLGVISGSLFFAGFSFQTFGQAASSVANAAFLSALNVIFIPFISRFFLNKQIPLKVYFASILAVVGVGILSFKSSITFQIGDILLLLGALSFALQIIYNEHCGNHNDPLSITCIQLLTMGILSLVAMPLTHQTNIPSVGWFSVFFLALISSALACFLQLYGQAHVEPSKASLILMLEAVFATFAAVFILGDKITSTTIFGGSLLLIAIVIVEYKVKKTCPKA